MASQVTNIPAGFLYAGKTYWDGAVLIDAALIQNSATAYLRRVEQVFIAVGFAGIRISISATATGTASDAGPEFSDLFEQYSGALTFDDGINSVVIAGPAHSGSTLQDPTEPYFWVPNNGIALNSFVQGRSASSPGITLTLSDGQAVAASESRIRSVMESGVPEVDARVRVTPPVVAGPVDARIRSVMESGVPEVDARVRVTPPVVVGESRIRSVIESGVPEVDARVRVTPLGGPTINWAIEGAADETGNLVPENFSAPIPVVIGLPGGKGIKGVPGLQGDQGIVGDTGAKGDIGIQGSQGAQGAGGATGGKGDRGIKGSQGSQGAGGATGGKGDRGIKGSQGSQGAEGPGGDGGPGETGGPGDDGPDGADGGDGADGADAVGPRGDFGQKGSKGQSGTFASYTDGYEDGYTDGDADCGP